MRIVLLWLLAFPLGAARGIELVGRPTEGEEVLLVGPGRIEP